MNAVIVIPTYNERNNIQLLVEEIFKVAPSIRILIVDDNSPDGTGRIADELTQKYPQVNVLHIKKKEGLGRAYIAGFKEALKMNPDYILQMDADFSHHPKYIPLFLKEIVDYDIVSASRFLESNKLPINVSILSLLARRYSRWILGLRITDPLGGFKCFRRKVLEEIELDKFISKGFVFQAEFTSRAFRKGFTVKEIPIYFYSRRFGETKKTIRIVSEAFFKVILLKYVYWFRMFQTHQ